MKTLYSSRFENPEAGCGKPCNARRASNAKSAAYGLSLALVCLVLFLIARDLQAQVVYQHHIGYPDPALVGRNPERIRGKAPGPSSRDRYAEVSEWERLQRIWEDECRRRCNNECTECEDDGECPLCADDPKTPCGRCKMCEAGFPCEKTLCRHCVQSRSMNMCNSCDLTAGDEPCGTCDACREHRSDPCEHADDGHGPRGEFNPYKEPRALSVIPRPILDMYNNGARKFPVYYNPAPYYRPHWNPSLFAGYARPFTFRWSCPLCYKDPCDCAQPGFAGQVPYAYACKFCNRNPCACAQDICNVNKPMDPAGISKALEKMNEESTRIQDRSATTSAATENVLSEEAPETLRETEERPAEPETTPDAPPEGERPNLDRPRLEAPVSRNRVPT